LLFAMPWGLVCLPLSQPILAPSVSLNDFSTWVFVYTLERKTPPCTRLFFNSLGVLNWNGAKVVVCDALVLVCPSLSFSAFLALLILGALRATGWVLSFCPWIGFLSGPYFLLIRNALRGSDVFPIVSGFLICLASPGSNFLCSFTSLLALFCPHSYMTFTIPTLTSTDQSTDKTRRHQISHLTCNLCHQPTIKST
jgi:hypothetical protein